MIKNKNKKRGNLINIANIMQELPFFVQTDHDIELTFESVKAQISYEMNTDDFSKIYKR